MGRRACSRGLAIGVALAATGCWVTLDPILESSPSGEGGTLPAETCTVIESESSQYSLCPDPLPLADAAARCHDWNAELAAIGSEEENDLLATQSYEPIGTNLWLGGSRDDALVWSWPDGTVFWRGGSDGALEPGGYAKWASGEPNNSSTVVDEPERCLVLTLDGNDWNDRACSLSVAYACERLQVAGP